MKHIVEFEVQGANQAEIEAAAKIRLANFTDGQVVDRVEIVTRPYACHDDGTVSRLWRGTVSADLPGSEARP
jgi:hypothetical protein